MTAEGMFNQRTNRFDFSSPQNSRQIFLRLIKCMKTFNRYFVRISKIKLALMLMAWLTCDVAVQAQTTKVFVGLGANNRWGTSANWDPAGTPAAGDDLIFGNTNAVVDSEQRYESFHFELQFNYLHQHVYDWRAERQFQTRRLGSGWDCGDVAVCWQLRL